MADHLHPAIDIPGEGLWEGACVAHSDGDGVTVEDQRGCHAVLCVLYDDDGEARLAHPSVVGLSLRLDDPLGLGLAGLAGRVAGRLGWDRQLVSVLLPFAVWAPPRWADMAPDAVLREAATLLARLDRLAAAVWPEYRPEAGVVPRWEQWAESGHAGWMLQRGGPARYFMAYDIPGTSNITVASTLADAGPDPLAALGAALEVCGG